MSAPGTPPRFIPTLTEVFHETPDLQAEPLAPHPPPLVEDQMVQRLMQRVDMVLERRLREAVAQLVGAHTQALVPRLREEIELVVRESVRNAVAHDFASQSAKKEQ